MQHVCAYYFGQEGRASSRHQVLFFPSPQLTNIVSKSSRPYSALSKNLYSLLSPRTGARTVYPYKITVCRTYKVCFLATACRYFCMIHTLYDIQLVCRNADISFIPLGTGINYILRVYKDSVCTSQRTQCVSTRKAKCVCYGHHAVLIDKMQGF